MATNAAARLARLTRRLGQIDQVIVTTAGRIVVDALDKQLARDTGGDSALSGFRGGRYRLGVDITPLRNPAGVRIRPKPKQAGMWTILDSGRSGGYRIAARNRRRRKGTKRGSSRAAGMRVGAGAGGVWRAGPFTGGAARGHHTWARGRDAGLTEAVAAVRAELRKVVADA